MRYVYTIILLISLLLPAQINAGEPQINISTPRERVRTTTDVFLVAMPVATLAGIIIERDWTGLKQAAFTTAATVGATYILKYSIKKNRPDLSDNHSFPSAHSSIMFANAAYIQRRYGWKLGIPAYTVATYVAWGRTYAKKHDVWDVLAGAAIGAGSAYIFTRPWAQKHDLTIVPSITSTPLYTPTNGVPTHGAPTHGAPTNGAPTNGAPTNGITYATSFSITASLTF